MIERLQIISDGPRISTEGTDVWEGENVSSHTFTRNGENIDPVLHVRINHDRKHVELRLQMMWGKKDFLMVPDHIAYMVGMPFRPAWVSGDNTYMQVVGEGSTFHFLPREGKRSLLFARLENPDVSRLSNFIGSHSSLPKRELLEALAPLR